MVSWPNLLALNLTRSSADEFRALESPAAAPRGGHGATGIANTTENAHGLASSR